MEVRAHRAASSLVFGAKYKFVDAVILAMCMRAMMVTVFMSIRMMVDRGSHGSLPFSEKCDSVVRASGCDDKGWFVDGDYRRAMLASAPGLTNYYFN